MKTANRLRYSFGIMLVAVVLIGAAAVAAMFQTASAAAVALSRSFQAITVMESLSEQAREYNVVASGFAATATLAQDDDRKLSEVESNLEAALVRLQAIDPASAEQARKVIADDRQQSRGILAPFASEEPAGASKPALPRKEQRPPPAPKPARKAKPGARAPAPAPVTEEPAPASAANAAVEELQLRLLSLQTGRRASLRLGTLHEQVTIKLSEIRDAQQAEVDRRLQGTASRARRFMALFLVLGLAAAGAIAVLFVGIRKQVLRPLQALADAARQVSAERDLTVHVPVSGDAEVQDLGRAFAEMMETLRKITTELRGATDRLLSASAELGGITRAQGDSLSRQASALEEARRTSTSLRETSRSAASRAESVLHVAQRAEELGRDGETAMTENLSTVEVVQGQTQQVVERIARLATSAQRIAAITGSVKDLADQSNVLALNAAIEASRAGEAGAGFGVVAREIRSLADRSIKATGEARTVLAEVLKGIRNAVGLVEAASSGLAEGTARTRRLGESVSGLSGIVRENLGAVRDIAGAVASQDAGIVQINAAVEDLSLMMEESLRSMNTTSQAANVLREVSEQVSSAVTVFRL